MGGVGQATQGVHEGETVLADLKLKLPPRSCLEHVGGLLHIPPRHGGADWLARLPRHVPAAGVAMVALHICPNTSIYEAVVTNMLS